MERLGLLQLCIVSLVVSLWTAPSHASTHMYDFWDAAAADVELPNHFLIDAQHGSVLVTAKNLICRLTLDLTVQEQFINAEPSENTAIDCRFDLRPTVQCQNYHHVLVFPLGPGSIRSGNGIEHRLNDTVLVCGSNAFDPMCEYRERTNLTVIRTVSGNRFCPYDQSSVASSLWTSSGQLISGTPLDAQRNGYGISLSTSPYSGDIQVGTLPNIIWFNEEPQFMAMYEIGEYIYTFFREEALEIQETVMFSRVARVCKNDTGTQPSTSTSDTNNIFTTFLKARITCSSSTGEAGDIPYYFNNLQGTFFLESGSHDGGSSELHLYGVFTAPENGPVGSAVCVYTFGSNTNDLENVFSGDYLKRQSFDVWVTEQNFNPFTCQTRRTVEDAERIQLMEAPVEQSNGNRPLMQLSGHSFRQVVVDTVQDLRGMTHEVMFIVAHADNNVVLLKVTYVLSREGEDKFHVSQEIVLDPEPDSESESDEAPPDITEVRLHGTGSSAHIYVGTTTGIFRVSASRCEAYTDCCECLSARDPYCGFDTTSGQCVAVDDRNQNSENIIQDVINGDIGACAPPPLPTPTPTPVPTEPPVVATPVASEAVHPEPSPPPAVDCGDAPPPSVPMETPFTTTHSTFTSTLSPSPTGNIDLPAVNPAGLSPSKSDSEHTWTIIGAVSGFIGGVVIGIIIMAVFYNRRNFWWHKYIPKRHDSISEDAVEKGAVRGKSYKSTGASNCGKEEEFTKNNVVDISSPGQYRFQPSETKAITNFEPPSSSSPRYVTHHPHHHPKPIVPVPPSPHRATGSVQGETPYQPGVPNGSPYRSAPSRPPYAVGSPYKTAPNGSPYRSPATRQRTDPNIKSNFRAEEHLSNHERQAYGRNILARTPSIDPSRKTSKLPNGSVQRTLPVSYSAQRGVQIHDSEMGSSTC